LDFLDQRIRARLRGGLSLVGDLKRGARGRKFTVQPRDSDIARRRQRASLGYRASACSNESDQCREDPEP
jgi:hypothetical protein